MFPLLNLRPPRGRKGTISGRETCIYRSESTHLEEIAPFRVRAVQAARDDKAHRVQDRYYPNEARVLFVAPAAQNQQTRR